METINDIVGINKLVELSTDLDNENKTIKSVDITSGALKIKYGLYIIKHQDHGMILEDYGVLGLLDRLKEFPDLLDNGNTVKFIGLTDDQQECTVFNVDVVEKKEEDMITVQLDTPNGGKRDIVTDVDDTIKAEESIMSVEAEGGDEVGASVEEQTVEEIKEEVVEQPKKETQQLEGNSDEPKTPDFEYVESLKKGNNEKKAKLLLEEYARTFGVDLKRNKKFDNMVSDFKEFIKLL